MVMKTKWYLYHFKLYFFIIINLNLLFSGAGVVKIKFWLILWVRPAAYTSSNSAALIASFFLSIIFWQSAASCSQSSNAPRLLFSVWRSRSIIEYSYRHHDGRGAPWGPAHWSSGLSRPVDTWIVHLDFLWFVTAFMGIGSSKDTLGIHWSRKPLSGKPFGNRSIAAFTSVIILTSLVAAL